MSIFCRFDMVAVVCSHEVYNDGCYDNDIDNISDEEILSLNIDQRTKCIVLTRVVGYHRPVCCFNHGKKVEHKKRRHFIFKTKHIE